MTHIGHSEKVFVMRIFIAALVLIFSLQSWSKADDIRDFEIEGMSIGDSLLDYLSEEEIKSNKKFLYNSKKEVKFWLFIFLFMNWSKITISPAPCTLE